MKNEFKKMSVIRTTIGAVLALAIGNSAISAQVPKADPELNEFYIRTLAQAVADGYEGSYPNILERMKTGQEVVRTSLPGASSDTQYYSKLVVFPTFRDIAVPVLRDYAWRKNGVKLSMQHSYLGNSAGPIYVQYLKNLEASGRCPMLNTHSKFKFWPNQYIIRTLAEGLKYDVVLERRNWFTADSLHLSAKQFAIRLGKNACAGKQ